jgi:hypothetical protein
VQNPVDLPVTRSGESMADLVVEGRIDGSSAVSGREADWKELESIVRLGSPRAASACGGDELANFTHHAPTNSDRRAWIATR